MSYNTLSLELQNILLVNHNYMTKWLVFIFIIFLSIFYIFEVWPNHKPTNYFTQAISRVFFYILSICLLLGSPLMLLAMSPEVIFLEWYNLFLKFYSIFTTFALILVFVDALTLGIFYMLSKAGLNLNNPRVNSIMKSFENNKHFLKMKKGGRNFG